MTLVRFYGQFHPACTHFPVALLLIAAFAELINCFRPQRMLHEVAVFNLHVGACSALVVASMGWAMAATMGIEPELKGTLFWHRWLGSGTALWAIFTVLLWWWQRRQSASARRNFYRTALFAGAVLVSVTGHLGGLLVYGLDFYSWSTK